MNKKIIAVLSVSIAVIIGIAIFKTLIVEQPKIFIEARESQTSNWYRIEGSPVIGASYNTIYEPDNRTLEKPSTANLGVKIYNNYSLPLYRVKVEVSYRMASDIWNTTSFSVAFLLPDTSEQVFILLTNPYLTKWHTRTPQYTNNGVIWHNVTVWVLETMDYKIMTPYGYDKQ